MTKQTVIRAHILYQLSGVAVLLGPTILNILSSVLTHTLVEIFSNIIAFSIFPVSWNTQRTS